MGKVNGFLAMRATTSFIASKKANDSSERFSAYQVTASCALASIGRRPASKRFRDG
jgi:hypothetical protein